MTQKKIRLLKFSHFFLFIVIILAAWLRLWQLNTLPPGLWFDESFNMMDTLWMLENRAPQIFFPANGGREPMLHYLGAVFMALFGITPYVFRLVSVFAGLLTGQPIAEIPFIQVINSRGEPISQIEAPPILDKMFRWRQNGIIRTEYPLWLGEAIAPGAYLVRMGLFNPATGRRLSIRTAEGAAMGDQITLGLFYVTDGRTDPRQPQVQLNTRFANGIRLAGYTLLPAKNPSVLSVKLHWVAPKNSIGTNYTAFVQLLDAQNQFVTGWDAQPLNGLYPTSRWQPDEVIVYRFDLPLPESLPVGPYHLVTGLYNLNNGQRLPAFDAAGQPLTEDVIVLAEVNRP